MWSGLDLLFPPACGGCGRVGYRWCIDCQGRVYHPPAPLCDLCGIPVDEAGLCLNCRRERPRFRALRSWSLFDDPVRDALHRLKYRRDIGLGDPLAAQLVGFALSLKWPIDLIVPVHLGEGRLQERGYNQVGLISRPLAMALGVVHAPDALSRIRETRSQVRLTKEERRGNVYQAFRGNERRARDRVVLLVDDVATTGATLSSCAEALYAAGAQDVFALSVSRALARHDVEGIGAFDRSFG